jgi:hypothetical protein
MCLRAGSKDTKCGDEQHDDHGDDDVGARALAGQPRGPAVTPTVSSFRDLPGGRAVWSSHPPASTGRALIRTGIQAIRPARRRQRRSSIWGPGSFKYEIDATNQSSGTGSTTLTNQGPSIERTRGSLSPPATWKPSSKWHEMGVPTGDYDCHDQLAVAGSSARRRRPNGRAQLHPDAGLRVDVARAARPRRVGGPEQEQGARESAKPPASEDPGSPHPRIRSVSARRVDVPRPRRGCRSPRRHRSPDRDAGRDPMSWRLLDGGRPLVADR